MKASDIVIDKNLSILMKGPFGFGKTLAAASFALEGPVYIAYFDKKKPIELIQYFTEKRFGAKAKKILNNIEYDIYGAHNVNDYLNKIYKFTNKFDYSTFITDSVTRLTSSAVNWSIGFRDPKEGPKKDPKNKNAVLTIPDFDEYKVETSLVSQAIDLCLTLPGNIIWIAHPVPSISIEKSGATIKVTKTNPIVTYGSKVAGMIPGSFTEVYHFAQISGWDQINGKHFIKYMVNTHAVGDESAKSPLLADYIKEFDITDKLFYEVWKELIAQARPKEPQLTETSSEEPIKSDFVNPFAEQPQQTKWRT